MADMSLRSHGWIGWLFVLPATLYLALFSLAPVLLSAWLSLHDWHLLKPNRTFVGLDNYSTLAADPFFRNALWNSLRFALLATPLSVISALLVAALVCRPRPGIGVFRTLFFAPAVSSQAALAMIWVWVFLPNVGLVNSALGALGLPSETDFLSQPAWALPAMVLLFAWIGLGPRMVLFLAGLQSIPESLHEAAALDGAGRWQRFRHLTLPLLLPTTLFVAVTSTIASFQFFTPIYMITRGGPRRSTDLVAYHIYSEAWTRLEIGSAAAQTFVLFAVILALAALQLLLLRRGLRGAES